MFPNLKVLNGYDKDGEECLSDADDEGDYEGEGEGLDDFIENKDLTPEDIEQLKKQGFVVAEDFEGDDEEGEGDDAEGEDDQDAKAGEKREKADEKEEKGEHKRQKTDE